MKFVEISKFCSYWGKNQKKIPVMVDFFETPYFQHDFSKTYFPIRFVKIKSKLTNLTSNSETLNNVADNLFLHITVVISLPIYPQIKLKDTFEYQYVTQLITQYVTQLVNQFVTKYITHKMPHRLKHSRGSKRPMISNIFKPPEPGPLLSLPNQTPHGMKHVTHPR